MGQSSPDPTAMQGIDNGWAMPPSFLVMLLHGNVGESGDRSTPEPVHTMSVLCFLQAELQPGSISGSPSHDCRVVTLYVQLSGQVLRLLRGLGWERSH